MSIFPFILVRVHFHGDLCIYIFTTQIRKQSLFIVQKVAFAPSQLKDVCNEGIALQGWHLCAQVTDYCMVAGGAGLSSAEVGRNVENMESLLQLSCWGCSVPCAV